MGVRGFMDAGFRNVADLRLPVFRDLGLRVGFRVLATTTAYL